MKQNMFGRILSLLVMLALLAAMASSFTACTEEDPPVADETTESTEETSETPKDDSILGEGETQIAVLVVFADGSEKSFTVHTDKENVGDALVEVGLIEGEEGSYGWYITTVDGEYHKWEEDGKYWALYIDGEYAMTGVSSTPITEGAAYSFKAE